MENYIGLIIAVEKYHNSANINTVLFAKNDAEKFIESLVELGCEKDKLKYLPDDLATKTTINEKIREISQYASPTDTIIFYYAGHGFYHNGKNLISCVDTSLNSLDTTTIDVNSILASFEKSKSKKVIVFLDCCHSGIKFSETERGLISNFSTDELKYKYNNAEYLTVFASCKSDERSQADAEREHGVWSYFLIQALSGNVKEIYDANILFSDKLQKYLSENTSQRVKKITPEKKNQTPVKFGKETTEKFIVADLSKVLRKKEIKESVEEIRFEKAIILVSEEDWVKNLPGFKSTHKPPKEISNYHNSWIKSISYELIEEELNNIAQKLKLRLKYKRKDIEQPLIEDGAGQLSTIDFDYVININQSQENSSEYIITRSIENFKNSDILNNSEFNELFKETFNELQFVFNKKIKVENIIDKIEDIDDEESISVEYDRTDTSNCMIKIKDFEGSILITEYTFTVQSLKKKSPQKLIMSTREVYKILGDEGVQKMLE